MSFGREHSKESKPTFFCSVCGAKILPKKIFCFECGPPGPLKKEPEETGISLEQAIFRITSLVFLFVCVVLIKFYVSTDDSASLVDKNREVQSTVNGKKIQGDEFELIHTVIPSSANVLSKPSVDGRVITIVEEGMNLNVIENKENWTCI